MDGLDDHAAVALDRRGRRVDRVASTTALGGRLEVGPRSAGSYPGPVAYALGGTEPTVTDANLVLGYLSPDEFFGGRMALDREAAEEAIQTQIAEPLASPRSRPRR